MFRFALKNLRANATRLIATAMAVVVGIAFLAAGLMLTDAMKDALDGTVEEQYAEVDLVVRPAASIDGVAMVVPVDVLDTARATPGVTAAAGELVGPATVLKADGTAVSSRSQGRAWIADDELNPLTLDAGRAPAERDEIVIDRDTAAEADLEPGDTTGVGTPTGPMDATVSGISSFGNQASIDTDGTISFSDAGAQEVLGGGTAGYTDVVIRTDAGSSDAAALERVRSDLEASVPPNVEVVTGAEFRAERQEQSSAILDLLRPVLQGFAYLALFVAGFVIFNTFSVVVTQRIRELALVRAVGGTPGQVRRSLMFEGLGIGVVASAIGIASGAALAKLLQVVLGAFDVNLPGSGVALTVPTIVLCMTAGTVVTVVSVAVPAFRAGRTKPVEAMRDSAVDSSGTSTVRAVLGGIALVLSLSLLFFNRLVDAQWYFLAPGALLLFLGLLIGGPLLARLAARVLQRPARRLGLTARLAVDNTVRNPRRTATTANALVIGLFLVTLVTISGDAFKTWMVDQINKLSSSDFIVAGSGAGLDPQLAAGIEDTEGVAASAPVRTALVRNTSDQFVIISGADIDELTSTTGLTVQAGSLDDVRDARGSAIVDLQTLGGGPGFRDGGEEGEGHRSPRGSDITIAGPPGSIGSTEMIIAVDGSTVELPVAASLEANIDTLTLGTLVSNGTLEELAGDQPISHVYVRTDPGDADEVGGRLDALVSGYTGVEVLPGNFVGEIVATVFDFLIGTVNALLGMSVLIALIGIINTLTLSIFERRRELGMVRALGMTRQQVRRMVRMEAVLIGILGTVIGVGAGLLLGWVVIGSIADEAIPLSVNWARLGLIALAGLLVGILASIIPGRRAVRMEMLDAMSVT